MIYKLCVGACTQSTDCKSSHERSACKLYAFINARAELLRKFFSVFAITPRRLNLTVKYHIFISLYHLTNIPTTSKNILSVNKKGWMLFITSDSFIRFALFNIAYEKRTFRFLGGSHKFNFLNNSSHTTRTNSSTTLTD